MSLVDINREIGTPITFKLGTAIPSPKLYELSGHFLKVRRVTDPTAEITVRLNTAAATPIDLKRGEGWQHFPFERLYVQWDAQAGVELELFIAGRPDEADPRLFGVFNSDNTANVSLVDVADGVELVTTPAPGLVDRLSGVMPTISGSHSNVPGAGDVLYTVPAGKILTIRSAQFSMGSAGDLGIAYITTAGSGSAANVMFNELPVRVWEGLRLGAGDKIRSYVNSPGSMDCFYTVDCDLEAA